MFAVLSVPHSFGTTSYHILTISCCFVVPAQVMVPDVAVLSRLLDPGCPYNPAMAARAAVEAASNGSEVRKVGHNMEEKSKVVIAM